MATITKRLNRKGEPTYRATIRRSGFPSTSRSFTSMKAAKAWARKVESDRDALREGTSEAHRVTFADCAKWHLEGRKAGSRRSAIPAHTGKDVTHAARVKWWVSKIGDVKLAEITAEMLRQNRDLLASGNAFRGNGVGKRAAINRPRSPGTTNRYVVACSMVLTHAMKYHELKENVARRVGWLKEARPRDRVLTADEIERLLDACRASAWPRLYLLVLTAIMTGARRGELLKLRYRDIDREANTATFLDTKNGSDRSVPLADPVIQELKRFPGIGDALVFPSERKPGRPFEIKKPWYQALEDADLADSGVVFHSLRHTAVTRIASNTAKGNIAAVAKLVGHKSLMTTQRYFHPDANDLRDLITPLVDVVKDR